MNSPSRDRAPAGIPRPGTRTRIGVVDDHPAVRQGLISYLAGRGDLDVCGEADNAAAALTLVENSRPELLVIDLSLEDGSGLELIKQIRSRFADVRMLVYSMHDEKLFAERALRAGAQGYVNKGEGLDVFALALDKVKRGKVHLSERMTEEVLDRRLRSGDEGGLPSPRDLSDRELEVFEALGRGQSTREVAEHLNLSVKTVESHRENIKRKLGLKKNVELLQQAFQWTMGRAE
jgi:DNA-binding NarL/FixJ family response regulator